MKGNKNKGTGSPAIWRKGATEQAGGAHSNSFHVLISLQDV